jgi:hypothetical protein
MIYSIFSPERGEYDYFESPDQLPLNADLPVPSLPPVAGQIGVPAMDAGRPLPGNAKPIGRGWHAHGMLARRSGGLGAFSLNPSGAWMVVVAGAIAAWLWYKQDHRRAA